MNQLAAASISLKEIEIACGREISAAEKKLNHIGVDPGKSGAIASIELGASPNVVVRKLGKDPNEWPVVASYAYYKGAATTLVEMPQLSRGRASFNAGIIYGICLALSGNHMYAPEPILVHPNTIKQCVTEMLSNLKNGGVNIVYPSADEDYGNKHDRIVLASTICGTTKIFWKGTGKVDDNATDAVCHALASLYLYGDNNE